MREIKCYIKSMLNPKGVAGLLRHILNHISKKFIKYAYNNYPKKLRYLLKLDLINLSLSSEPPSK